MTDISTVEPVQKKKRGCFFYGCITCIILAVLVAIGVGVATHYAYKFMSEMVSDYTDTSPIALPSSGISADDLKKLNERMAAFDAAVDAHTNVPPLVLTGPELTALINDCEPVKAVGGKVYLTLDGDQIKGQMSLPLDNIQALQMLNAKGRYFNGSGTFKASVSNGNLSVSIISLEVKGKPLPPKYVAAFQTSMSQQFNGQPNKPAFDSYESIQVKDGTLVVTPKKN
ncbi:MAG TPA: hypothetical protein VH413_01310 [Verrucomicrobiae bacterium]|jgi:hypothetical protein|nr:hypothetical protein [Verrucomicrobiae bacterium]